MSFSLFLVNQVGVIFISHGFAPRRPVEVNAVTAGLKPSVRGDGIKSNNIIFVRKR